MKKFLVIFSLLGLFTFITPKVANSAVDPCTTEILQCCDGTEHYVVICDDQDWNAWEQLLCGPCTG